MTNTPKPAPATPAATPREANQQRVDAAAQRVRQKLYKCDDTFRKDVELLIEIALAPVLEIFAAAQPAATPMAATRKALAKFKGLAKEFRREASRWKKLDTSIAKTRQDAFIECASDIEAAVKALEQGQQYEYQPAAAQPQRESEPCTTAESAITSTSEDIRPTASNAVPFAGRLLPDPEWSALSKTSQEKIAKWFDLACERLQLILDARESEQPEQALREALKSSMVALDDWLNIHFPNDCDKQRVKEARQIVNEHGTIHYIGTVQDRNRAALSPQTDSQETPSPLRNPQELAEALGKCVSAIEVAQKMHDKAGCVGKACSYPYDLQKLALVAGKHALIGAEPRT